MKLRDIRLVENSSLTEAGFFLLMSSLISVFMLSLLITGIL
jgi:hypothetical protein